MVAGNRSNDEKIFLDIGEKYICPYCGYTNILNVEKPIFYSDTLDGAFKKAIFHTNTTGHKGIALPLVNPYTKCSRCKIQIFKNAKTPLPFQVELEDELFEI